MFKYVKCISIHNKKFLYNKKQCELCIREYRNFKPASSNTCGIKLIIVWNISNLFIYIFEETGIQWRNSILVNVGPVSSSWHQFSTSIFCKVFLHHRLEQLPFSSMQGCIFFILQKIWVIGWLGKKYDDLLIKNVQKRVRGGKDEIFTVLGGKISFWKNGGGQKYQLFG